MIIDLTGCIVRPKQWILMGNMVASEYGIPYAKCLHKRLHISENEQLRRHCGNNDATFALNEK
jgi:hypothetical protein